MKRLFESAADFVDKEIQIEYLVEGVIEKDTIGVMFGETGIGKSFLALDIGLAVATGATTLNGKQANKGVVLYIAGEGRSGIKRRVKALRSHCKMTRDELNLFYLSISFVGFINKDVDSLISEGIGLQNKNKCKVALIIIDTLARHMDGDENSAKDMGNLVSGISRLQSVFPGSVVLLVHHTGNNNKDRSRGSSALKAAMDFEICVKRGNISFTKMKDAEAPGNLSFKLLPVEISSGLSDESSASCVVEYKEFSSSGNRRKLSDSSQLGLKALSAVCATKRQNDDDSYTVQIDDWREQFYSLRNEAEPEAKKGALKKSFQRVRDDLQEHELISIKGDEVTWHSGISGTRDKRET